MMAIAGLFLAAFAALVLQANVVSAVVSLALRGQELSGLKIGQSGFASVSSAIGIGDVVFFPRRPTFLQLDELEDRTLTAASKKRQVLMADRHGGLGLIGRRSRKRKHRSPRQVTNLRDNVLFEQEVQKEVEKVLAGKIEEKMKFFPGMTSIEQLLQWNASVAGPRMGPAKQPALLRQGKRIMSLHDMAGNYQEKADNDYLMMFKSWQTVDLFVYFSHVRVSVPPLQWTAIAHEHRRPALGTLILEATPESYDASRVINEHREAVLTKLVEVADHYGFDGWFVNVEGGTWLEGDPENFVRDLRDRLHKKLGKSSQVIAYPYGPEDAMFGAADGVFVDYNWPADDETLSKVAKAAGNRSSDVYMGMDGFGEYRGNTEPDPEHVQLCAKHNLSISIFAPGVTFEKAAGGKFSMMAVDYDHRYWNSISSNFGRRTESDGAWPVLWQPS